MTSNPAPNTCLSLPFSPRFADPRRFALQLTQVIKLRSPNTAGAHDLDFLDSGRMQGEDTFHPVAKGDLANGESGVARTTPQSNGRSLEDLYTFLVAFLDLNVDANCVPCAELGNVRF